MADDPGGGDAGVVTEPDLLRSWRSIMFAPVGDGQRRRRGSDGARLIGAVLTLLACVLVIRYNSGIDRAIVEVIHPPPRSITWLVTVVYDAGAFGVTALLVVLALVARRWSIARDIALSVLGTAVVTGVLVVVLGSRGGRPSGVSIDGYHLRFPVLQIAVFMAVATATLPYLARGLQRLVELFIALVGLASAVGGHGLPINIIGSLAIGWGVTALVHLVFGSPLGLPSVDDVRALLDELSIGTTALQPQTRQVWGVAKYQATLTDRGDSSDPGISISVYGRDAADAKLLTKVGRSLLYRDSGPSLTLTRLQQVEHEAYLTLRAGQAGARVPEIVEASLAGPARDALMISRSPAGAKMSEVDPAEVGDDVLDDLYRQLLALRRARISHGAVSGDTVVVDPASGTVTLVDFRNATSNASPDQLNRDLAGALAATAVTVGADRAAGAAARCLTSEEVRESIQHLRKAGLDPTLGRSLRGERELLEDVRQRVAGAKSMDVPKLVEPRRVSLPTFIMMIGTL